MCLLAALHSVCIESTLHRPSSSLPVSAECKNMLTVDIPMSAAIAVHVILLSFSHTAPTCSKSLICHGCRRSTASSITYIFPPPSMAFTTISSTGLYRNKMPVSTSDAVNNSKPSYFQTANTAFSNSAHFLQ